MTTENRKINIIVGGGLTGLACAYTLVQGGEPCLLIEKKEKIGGLTQSFHFHDCIFDLGPHVLLWDNATPAANLVKALMDQSEYRITNWKMNFFMNEKYYGFPLGLLDYVSLPKSYSLSFLKSALFYSAKDKSFQESMVSHVGNKMYQNFFSPYINKKAGCADGGKQLHEDWWIKAKRNLRNEIVRCADGDMARKDKFQYARKLAYIFLKFINVLKPKDKMYYPRAGISVIPNKIWKAYQKKGGQTLLNCENITLVNSNNQIHQVRTNGHIYHVKNLIWTARAPELYDLLSVQADPMYYVSSGLVFLVLNRKIGFGKKVSCTYYPQPDIIFSRVYYPSYFCEETVPDGKDAICVELIVEGDLTTWSSEDIIEKTKHDLERLNICGPNDIEAAEFKKLSRVYPIYSLDYETRLSRVRNQLDQYNNLYTIGRLGGFYFCMMYDAINQGIETAKHILESKQKELAMEGGGADR